MIDDDAIAIDELHLEVLSHGHARHRVFEGKVMVSRPGGVAPWQGQALKRNRNGARL